MFIVERSKLYMFQAFFYGSLFWSYITVNMFFSNLLENSMQWNLTIDGNHSTDLRWESNEWYGFSLTKMFKHIIYLFCYFNIDKP